MLDFLGLFSVSSLFYHILYFFVFFFHFKEIFLIWFSKLSIKFSIFLVPNYYFYRYNIFSPGILSRKLFSFIKKKWLLLFFRIKFNSIILKLYEHFMNESCNKMQWLLNLLSSVLPGEEVQWGQHFYISKTLIIMLFNITLILQ